MPTTVSNLRRSPASAAIALAAGAMLVLCGVSAAAPGEVEKLPPPPPRQMPENLRMQSTLFDAQQLALRQDMTTPRLREELQSRNIVMRGDRRVHVEVVGPEGGAAADPAIIQAVGGQTDSIWSNRVDAWVPVDRLRQLAMVLPEGYLVVHADTPSLDSTAGEGPDVTNSITYKNGGADGTGRTVAVIDLGFARLSEARSTGDAPPLSQTAFINLTGSATFEVAGDQTHGTGCVEAIYDHCPGAKFRLYKIDSLADFGVAVADCIINHVDVISHSGSRYNTGWDDDSGPVCLAATQACNAGIIFVTSAGNRAVTHWEGLFADPNANGWHDWDPAGDETLGILVPAGTQMVCDLSWKTSTGSYNYDLYIYDAAFTTVLASSTNATNVYEECSWTNNTGVAKLVNVGVRRVSGGITPMELFTYSFGDWQEHIVSYGSTTSPSNTTHPLCISVGAVDYHYYGLPFAAVSTYYTSSQGPSNSGMVLPDVAGPTFTHGQVYPFGFDGTSCATANTAGAITAFLSSTPSLTTAGARHLVGRQAQIFRDWGSTGPDTIFGSGGVYLYDYAPGTAWIDRTFGPPPIIPPGTPFYAALFTAMGTTPPPYQPVPTIYQQPFYYVQHAHNWAPNGGRLLFLGQSYPEPVSLIKPLTVTLIGPSGVTLGQ